MTSSKSAGQLFGSGPPTQVRLGSPRGGAEALCLRPEGHGSHAARAPGPRPAWLPRVRRVRHFSARDTLSLRPNPTPREDSGGRANPAPPPAPAGFSPAVGPSTPAPPGVRPGPGPPSLARPSVGSRAWLPLWHLWRPRPLTQLCRALPPGATCGGHRPAPPPTGGAGSRHGPSELQGGHGFASAVPGPHRAPGAGGLPEPRVSLPPPPRGPAKLHSGGQWVCHPLGPRKCSCGRKCSRESPGAPHRTGGGAPDEEPQGRDSSVVAGPPGAPALPPGRRAGVGGHSLRLSRALRRLGVRGIQPAGHRKLRGLVPLEAPAWETQEGTCGAPGRPLW